MQRPPFQQRVPIVKHVVPGIHHGKYGIVLGERIGLSGILLLAFAMQIALVGVLALSNAPAMIALLLFRMVPNSLSQPFILARTQPLLDDETRATYISLRSFCGRLVFAASLYVASFAATDADQMTYPELQLVLGWYLAIGAVALVILAILARRIRLETPEIP